MSLYAINRERGTAIYAQIARQIEQEIGQVYGVGEWLPSELELALRFGVNRHTLRRAIDDLVEGGLLERRHGRGIRVIASPFDYRIGIETRFTETLHAQGATTESRVLRKQIVPANEAVAHKLSLRPTERVLWIETLRMADNCPLCVISHFLPAEQYPEVGEEYSGGSLHLFLRNIYSIVLRRTESLVTARLPQGDDARVLSMPQNRPVLRVKSVNVDDVTGVPVEYAITRFRADIVQLSVTF
jgi:GntR family phosphonate transport system transcriptional regulator